MPHQGGLKDWKGLPPSKSLFSSRKGYGLPIGNLTSQVFANYYMTAFDHYIKHGLGVRYYGRYVDDMVFVHEDKEYLKGLIQRVSAYLSDELGLKLNPKKIVLQHYSKGVKFLGCVIMPHRIYIANRTKGNFYAAVERYNTVPAEKKREMMPRFRSGMNSYLGIMSHYSTYKIRKKEIYRHLSSWYLNRMEPKKHCRKIVLK